MVPTLYGYMSARAVPLDTFPSQPTIHAKALGSIFTPWPSFCLQHVVRKFAARPLAIAAGAGVDTSVHRLQPDFGLELFGMVERDETVEVFASTFEIGVVWEGQFLHYRHVQLCGEAKE